MPNCFACPRACGADRNSVLGICGMKNEITLARAALHFGEEPCISGEKGSGTVFFSGCSLGCVYCQNSKISHERFGKEISADNLMKIFDSLIDQGANNINLVTPTHFASLLAEILRQYKSKVPIIYNSSGYETVDTLRSFDGLIDIYLPDLKYYDNCVSKKYSNADNYFEFASMAILEMQRQVGTLELNEDKIAVHGIMVRHLVLPGNVEQTLKILRWIKENMPSDTAISMMNQYTPCGSAVNMHPLNRRTTKREYEKAVDAMIDLGFENGYIQESDSSGFEFIPDFNLKGIT